MKEILTILTAVILLYGCDNRADQVNSFNDAPFFTFDGDTITNLVDSLKVSRGNYTVRAKFVDPNENLTSLELLINGGSGNFSLNGSVVQGQIATVTNQNVLLNYNPLTHGKHLLVITQFDAFDEKSSLDVELVVFENLDPIAILTIENPSGSGPFERNINAASSFDGDKNFGGRIVEYEYSFLGKVVLTTNNNQSVIFPSNGVYNIVVRVKDNDGVWSEPESKNVNI